MSELFEILKEWTTEPGLQAAVLRINHEHYSSFQRTFFSFDGNDFDHHFCGYIKVDEGHPLYGVFYGDLEDHFGAHGTFTFSDDGSDGYPSKTDGGWWFGFDCGHSGDDVRVFDVEFVEKECERLAECLTRGVRVEVKR